MCQNMERDVVSLTMTLVYLALRHPHFDMNHPPVHPQVLFKDLEVEVLGEDNSYAFHPHVCRMTVL